MSIRKQFETTVGTGAIDKASEPIHKRYEKQARRLCELRDLKPEETIAVDAPLYAKLSHLVPFGETLKRWQVCAFEIHIHEQLDRVLWEEVKAETQKKSK